jgi:2-polyprenyl-3-methyl-5-hydroxy-6-metoxy-1,4-benzoquinol methylase
LQSQAVAEFFISALEAEQAGRLNEAALGYKRVLKSDPRHAEAANNLGRVLLEQGRLREASAAFARALELAPQLFGDFRPIAATLSAVLPALARAVQTASSAWPARPRLKELFPTGSFAAIAVDPLLSSVLCSAPGRDISYERTLTGIRAGLLEQASTERKPDPATLAFSAALAEQCFINEYVFAVTPGEEEQVDRLAAMLDAALSTHQPVSHLQIAAVAMYRPLHRLSNAQVLLKLKVPPALDSLLTQHLREPEEERRIRQTIPALTDITDDVSMRVREQYEENPYPRWVHAAAVSEPLALSAYLQTAVLGDAPEAEFGDGVEVLVAGCGTGSHPIELARKLRGARVLAIDLSLSSLAYATRKTPPDLAGRIEYAQADILKLNGLGRSFDVIDSTGVLHHLENPDEGLRALLPLLRPRGLLHLGFYSQVGRRDIQAARDYLAKNGFKPTVEDIRRAREVLLNSELRIVAQANDFYTTSECRDLLFHVQEHHMTIPQIKAMLERAGLRFLGFSFDPPTLRGYAELFARAGKRPSDLDAWHEFEVGHPGTFRGMYQFWCQRRG